METPKKWDAGKKNKGGPRQRPRERSKRGEANGGGITYFFAVAGTRFFGVLQFYGDYSPLKATTGSSFAARLAGFSPKNIPTNTEKPKAIRQAFVFTINALD